MQSVHRSVRGGEVIEAPRDLLLERRPDLARHRLGVLVERFQRFPAPENRRRFEWVGSSATIQAPYLDL
jgi:hypothetical protein